MSPQSAACGQPDPGPETPVSEPPKKRGRPALACVQCRRRKARCDQNMPCNNCTKSRITDCTYPPTHTPGSRINKLVTPRRHAPSLAPRAAEPTANQPPQSHSSSLRDRLQHDAPQEARFASSTTQSPVVGASEVILRPRIGGIDVDALLTRINELEETVSKLSSPPDLSSAYVHRMEDSTATQTSTSPARNSTSKHQFENQSNWMSTTSLVSRDRTTRRLRTGLTNQYSKVLRVLSHAQAEQPQLRQALAKCKALGKEIDQWFSVKNAPSSIGMRIPERPFADQLLEAYFRNFEGRLRVLHIPTFRAEYQQYWQQRDAATDLFILQLQVCMALGATAFVNPWNWRNRSSQWLLEAQAWLHPSPGESKEKPTFKELQLACLVLIAEANVSGTADMHQCWVDAGNLVRKAMSIGLHRDPKYLGNMTVHQAEMRRRLWVTILELNLQLSLQAGQPPLVSVSDYNSCPPSNLKDEELSDAPDTTRPPSIEPRELTEMTTLLAFFDSFNLRLEIACKVNSVGPDMSYGERLRLHSELSKAKGRMQQRFAAFTDHLDAGDLYTSVPMTLAEILLSRYFLALHLPVLGRSIGNPEFHFSRRFCLATSIQMVEASGILSNYECTPTDSKAMEHISTLASLFTNSPGAFRHVIIQAVFAIALELITFREEERDSHVAFPVWDVTKLLMHLNSAQEWAADQIRAGLTDNRTHGFIAACIAYADALKSGTETSDVDRCIVEAALKSTERCWTVMDGVAKDVGLLPATPMPSMDNLGGYLKLADTSFDWDGNFTVEEMEGFSFDWTYPVDPGLESTSGMTLGPMAF